MSDEGDWISRVFAAARLRRSQPVPPPRLVVTKPSVSTLRKSSQQRLCPDCNGSGYASTIDGRTLGTCRTCDGTLSSPGRCGFAGLDDSPPLSLRAVRNTDDTGDP